MAGGALGLSPAPLRSPHAEHDCAGLCGAGLCGTRRSGACTALGISGGRVGRGGGSPWQAERASGPSAGIEGSGSALDPGRCRGWFEHRSGKGNGPES